MNERPRGGGGFRAWSSYADKVVRSGSVARATGFRVAVRYAPERCFRGGGFASKSTGWWFGAPMTLDRVDLQATSFGFRVVRRCA